MNLEKEDVEVNIIYSGRFPYDSQDIFLASIESGSLLTAVYFLCGITFLFYMILKKLRAYLSFWGIRGILKLFLQTS